MKEKIPWRRVSIEGAVIVVSILLALAADAAWESRQERRAEQEALRSLEVDFSANLEQLRGVIATHELSAVMFAQLQAMSADQIRGLSADSVDLYARAIGVPYSFDSRDGTLDALVASGSLALVSDPGLRSFLVEWRSLVATAGEEARNLRLVTERIVERESELGGPWRRVRPGEGTERGLAMATRDYPRADLDAATRDAEFMRLARWKQLNAAVYLIQLRNLETHADSVLTLVAANRR